MGSPAELELNEVEHAVIGRSKRGSRL